MKSDSQRDVSSDKVAGKLAWLVLETVSFVFIDFFKIIYLYWKLQFSIAAVFR